MRVIIYLYLIIFYSVQELYYSLVITEPCCSVYEHRNSLFGPELYTLTDSSTSDSLFPNAQRPKLTSLQGTLILSPSLMCGEYNKPKQPLQGDIFLVARGGCSFAEKVFWSQKSGALAVIVFEASQIFGEEDSLVVMAEDSRFGGLVDIPSVFISYNSWRRIEKLLRGPEVTQIKGVLNATGSVGDGPGDEALPLLWESVVFLVKVFVVLWSLLGCAYLTSWVRLRYKRWQRLAVLNTLPTHTFDENSKLLTESCVICLSDFEAGEVLTQLPCNHSYHKACIHPWLTAKSSLCPICKHSIFNNGEHRPVSEIDSDVHSQGENNDQQRTTSLALSLAMFVLILLSFTFMLNH